MTKTALVVGASGLVGRALVFELLKSKDYLKIIVLVRTDLVLKHPKLEQHIIDFDNLQNYSNIINADDVFCCLGTTYSQTPDKALYRKIDLVYPLTVAKIALQNQASHFIMVSAMGADKNSKIFYNRLKGEAEEAILQLNYPSISIVRPALLLGSRKKIRPVEQLAQYIFMVINPLMIGPLKMGKAIKAEIVARAMLKLAKQSKKGKQIYMNNELFDLAK
jgi:uncharacterized protein YbjT (DUF2867 family)